MELILSDKSGLEVCVLDKAEVDIDLNDTRDFEMKLKRGDLKDTMKSGARVYIPNTEYGGIIGAYSTDTAYDTVTFSGYTWRGLLDKKVIEPDSDSGEKTVSGSLESILKELVEPKFGGLFRVSDIPQIDIENFKFERYVSLLNGIYALLKSVNFRLKLSYRQGEPNGGGYIQLSAAEIKDYSDEIELSQDSRLDFKMTKVQNGVNHLIGIDKDSKVASVHLYVQSDGSIGQTQYYKGADEIVGIYEGSADDMEEFKKSCTDKLSSLMNYSSFEMNITELDADAEIGDTVSGRDYMTGMYMAKPIENKIITVSDGVMAIEYRLEGAE